MAIPVPSQEEILTRIYNRIVSETNITASLEGSNIGVLLKIIAAEMDGVWKYVQELATQSDLTTATGGSLDNFGYILGVPRKKSTEATTLGNTRSTRFTNVGSVSAYIPSGTRIYKESNPQIAYFTNEAATLSAGQSVDLHVTAAFPGENYNASIGELNRHSVSAASLTVTNILPILNGSLGESDASYRQRLLQEMQRRYVLNVTNTDALVRSNPGVKDAFIMEGVRGDGTFDVVVVPYNESATNSVISEVQSLLDDAKPIGTDALVKGPRYRQMDIRISLRFSPDAGTQKETLRQQIRSQISSRVRNLPVEDGSGNGTFFTSIVKSLAVTSSNLVLDAVVSLGLDGSTISNEGSINLTRGERITLRSISVD